MEFLERVLEEGRSTLPLDRYDDFLGALRHSLTVEPSAYSPENFDSFGFSQRELYTLRVLLLRPLAFEFVQALGSDIPKSRFDKRSSYDAYERHYQRQPWLISVKPRVMLLTYTEWTQLVLDAPPEIPLPDALRTA